MSAQKRGGFTLVELLVVISIIAILSVIGITIFTGVQKSARDARRRADIDAVATAMESNFNGLTGKYTPLSDTMFASGLPKDPTGTTSYHWCDTTNASNNPVCADAGNPIGNNDPDGRANWMVCASLEAGRKYCLKNRQ